MNRLFIISIQFILLFSARLLSAQADTIPPHITAKDLLTANSTPSGLTTIWVPDFIDTVYDNQPANLPIELGIRRICTGTGFPENTNSLTFVCFEHVMVEVWARDAAGNTASDLCSVFIQDQLGTCEPAPGIQVQILTPEMKGIEGVSLLVKGHNCLNDSFYIANFDYQSWWAQGIYQSSEGTIPGTGYQSTITPAKGTNPLNGVSAYDMVLIAKHILNIQPFTTPFQFLAADVNQDGQINQSDILIIKQLIQGDITEFPNGKSWRFVPKGYIFQSPNPLQVIVPERIDVPNTGEPVPGGFSFYGIKLGDLNHSADPGL